MAALRRAIDRERACLAQVRQAAAAQRADAMRVTLELEGLQRQVQQVSAVLQERVAVGHELERALAAGKQRLEELRALERAAEAGQLRARERAALGDA